MSTLNPLTVRAQAERMLARPGLTARQEAVAIVRAVHPCAKVAQLAAMCGLTCNAYAAIWRRLTRQHNGGQR